ncbi:uncharacterized protein LOC143628370 [Bidens hawaiensis]|uniref:uncharacterized protein LOC143628370 n=1 Tax=Bidens hawaiensis TaxID=980011 RepID=UPI0040493E4B
MKKLLYKVNPSIQSSILEWNNWVPLKVKAISWRALHNHLPISENLIKRSILYSPDICVCCTTAGESVDHIFASCYVENVVWQRVNVWCNLQPVNTSSVRDILLVYKQVPDFEHRRKMVQAIIMVAIWCLLRARNKLIFENKPLKMENVI